MGYTTEFEGNVKIEPAVNEDLKNYINRLASTRRMKRCVNELKQLYKGEHGYNGDYGVEGEFFAKDSGDYGQSKDSSIIEYNSPATTQPGLWLQWNISEDGTEIIWDGGEKFYNSEEWMTYIIDKFLSPNGHVCNGVIDAQGEDEEDIWKLIVKNNNVHTE